jgi:hypothetical protein
MKENFFWILGNYTSPLCYFLYCAITISLFHREQLRKIWLYLFERPGTSQRELCVCTDRMSEYTAID